MKITIVIEDGKVTTSQEYEQPLGNQIGASETTGQGQIVDAGAAPGAVRDEALMLAEAEGLPAGLEPDYSAPETAAMGDEADAGAAPAFEEEDEQD